MSDSIENPIVKELVTFKLNYVTKEIEKILSRWNEVNIDDFLEKAKKGRLEEAENDAIDLKQLILEQIKLSNYYKTL